MPERSRIISPPSSKTSTPSSKPIKPHVGVGVSFSDAADTNPNAAALGRLGGTKGGPARAASLSANERSKSASHAAKKRWERGG